MRYLYVLSRYTCCKEVGKMKITKAMVDKFREHVSQVGMPHAEKELGISQQTLWNWMNKKFPEDPRGSNSYKFLAWYERKFSINRAIPMQSRQQKTLPKGGGRGNVRGGGRRFIWRE